MTRRLQILRRAAEVFERQGVAQTSIEDIANEVGIKREGIYYYFKSREDILLELILPQSDTLLRSMRNIMATTATNRDKLRAAIEMHVNSYSPGYLETTVMLREKHIFKDQKKLDALRRVWRDYTGLWEQLVADGQRAGEFSDDLDPKMVTYGVLGMCNWMARWYTPNKGLEIPEITDTFFRLCAYGLMRNGPNANPGPDTP